MPEHARFAEYLRSLASVPEADEFAVVAAVFGDTDQVMAESAVVRHLDRRAEGLCRGPEFSGWVAAMDPVLDRYPFAAQRLREWTLFTAITLAQPWRAEEVIAASDWLQRKVAESGISPAASAVLAEAGRTRRVRAKCADFRV
jgi:hypothetical protein